MKPEPASDLSAKYSDNVWLRSIVQAVPYLGPLIDNAVSIPSSSREKKNLYEFLEQVHQLVQGLKKFQNKVYDLDDNVADGSIFPDILNGVRQSRDPRKLTYYRNMFWAYEFFRTRDYSKALDVFPEHFLKMIQNYSSAHIDTLIRFQEYLRAGPTSFTCEELQRIFKELNIPGGCFMKILLDFERDCLIDIFFRDNRRRYSLLEVEFISQTGLWDDFFMSVIDPPILPPYANT
jgi:hypothetical protein